VLVLDGLELTGGVSLERNAVSRLLVRHCTVRRPGASAIANADALDGVEIAIDRSIVGPIAIDDGASTTTGRVVVTDSIVSTDDAPGDALTAAPLDGQLQNVTIFGGSAFRSLEATNVIFVDRVLATRRQSGCVRYSWVPSGSSVPRRFRCQPDLAVAAATARKTSPLSAAEKAAVELGIKPVFIDHSLDEPTVAMLHPLVTDAIRLGGEHDSEMGVFSVAAEGLRMANVTTLFDDYVPLGLEAGLIDDTRSSTVALRRNRP
jgi:hypothetical protein